MITDETLTDLSLPSAEPSETEEPAETDEDDCDPWSREAVPLTAAERAQRMAQRAEREQQERIAAVRRHYAELEAREAMGLMPPARRPASTGSSSVFALRLGHDERATLEARAAALRVRPSVLARNLIRIGLTRTNARTDELLDQLDSGLVELRAALAR